jgi:hypothetical protein
MSAKQWLLITFVVILNIIVFGAVLGDAQPRPLITPTAVWTPYPTFTPMPFPTTTAIVMPTVRAAEPEEAIPTPQVHVVQEGETLESIAEQYGIGTFVLKLLNRMSEEETIRVGQRLIVPSPDQ